MEGILYFGDSITFGCGETPNKGWCGRLKECFEKENDESAVYNLGVPGHTSTDLLKRFDAESAGRLRFRHPSEYLIIIAIGTNDCKMDITPKGDTPRTTEVDFQENIHELIQKAKKCNAKTAFIGLPPVDEKATAMFDDTRFSNQRVEKFNNMIMSACLEEDIPFLDMLSIMSKERYDLLLDDGLHPNSKGYDFMAQQIIEFLKERELLPR